MGVVVPPTTLKQGTGEEDGGKEEEDEEDEGRPGGAARRGANADGRRPSHFRARCPCALRAVGAKTEHTARARSESAVAFVVVPPAAAFFALAVPALALAVALVAALAAPTVAVVAVALSVWPRLAAHRADEHGPAGPLGGPG